MIFSENQSWTVDFEKYALRAIAKKQKNQTCVFIYFVKVI